MEASALTHAGRLRRLRRRTPLLRTHGDERLIALTRRGDERAFEALVNRYQARLLAFCRGMLKSSEDAEDVLQEVFVAAHKAILADNRPINARPWLYRIARNRCLNHLRKPVPEGQDSMDVHPHEHGVTTAERVQQREEFRALIGDVQELPETQRSALLLREIDALTYEEIAASMETTVPAVKSLLVRARMSLADSSQARLLTCDEVHLHLAEAAEGLRKLSGPARFHLRDCEECREYRAQLRYNGKTLAALAPVGPLLALPALVASKLGFGHGGGLLGGKAGAGAAGAGASGAGTGGAAGAAATSAAAGAGTGGLSAIAGSSGLTIAGTAAAGGLGGALGSKAAAGFVSMALLTAGPPAAQAPQTAAITPPDAKITRSAVPAQPARRSREAPAGASAADRAQDKQPLAGDADPAAEQNSPGAGAPASTPAPEASQPPAAVAGGAAGGTGVAGGSTGAAPSPHTTPTPPPADPAPPVGVDPPPADPPPAEPAPTPAP